MIVILRTPNPDRSGYRGLLHHRAAISSSAQTNVGAIVDLAGEGARGIERCRNTLVHADADAQVALCVDGGPKIATPVCTERPSLSKPISVSTSLSCTFFTTPAERVVRWVISSMKRWGSAASIDRFWAVSCKRPELVGPWKFSYIFRCRFHKVSFRNKLQELNDDREAGKPRRISGFRLPEFVGYCEDRTCNRRIQVFKLKT